MIPVSEAKGRLSELIRQVRNGGQPIVLSVDGEPAVELRPAARAPRELNDVEVATSRALLSALQELPSPPPPFDALEAVRDGRR